MDLSFQEKSAWGLLISIVAVSLFYFPAAFRIVDTAPSGAPLIGISVAGVLAIVIIQIAYHAFIAVGSKDETDERDALINLKAERNSGFVLGSGLIALVGFIISQSIMGAYPVPSPLEAAVWILLAMTVAEMAKLASQIWYYRVGV